MAVAVVTAPADSLHRNHARSSVHRPSSSSVVVAHGPWRHVSHADHRLSSRRHETHDAGEWMGWRSCAGVSVQLLRLLVFVVVGCCCCLLFLCTLEVGRTASERWEGLCGSSREEAVVAAVVRAGEVGMEEKRNSHL